MLGGMTEFGLDTGVDILQAKVHQIVRLYIRALRGWAISSTISPPDCPFQPR